MIHNIKLPDGTIKAVDCKLGSGIFDKYRREIFEGDIVRCTYQGTYGFNAYEFTVEFKYGVLWTGTAPLSAPFLSDTDILEIVGHAED